MAFNEQQLTLINEINNIIPGRCDGGCIDSCRFASLVAARILFHNDLKISETEANNCENYHEIADKVARIQQLLNQNTSTTE